MQDVAQAAGVSMMTVSRVVNNKDDVSPATRDRVLEVIQQLNYRPSSIARGLVTQRTGALGVVVPDIANPFFSSIVRIAEEEAYAKGYSVFLGNTNEEPERELAVLQSLEDNFVDGLILCSSRLEDDRLAEVLDRFPSAVLVFRDRKNADVGSITLDDVHGGEEAVRHLAASGHRNIGLISGPVVSMSTAGRLRGYQKALRQAGLPLNENWVRHCPPVVESGYEYGKELLQEYPEITALFCHNDLVAVGVLHACAELGRRVPEDLAVIGFDDIRLAALVTPSLTTLHVPRASIGTRAMKMLLSQMSSDNGSADDVHLKPELIVRQSAP
jgi:DNA-binding LacI/PurR family transcriptional regulator